jgi:hypothetical protein
VIQFRYLALTLVTAAQLSASVLALPPATATVSANSTPGSNNYVSLTLPPAQLPLHALSVGSDGSAEAVATGGVDPAVAVSASFDQSDSGQSGADAQLTYFLEVLGPTLAVDIDVAASLAAAAGDLLSEASASLTISGPSNSINGTLDSDTLGEIGGSPGSTNQTVATALLLQTGFVYHVELSASAASLCRGTEGDCMELGFGPTAASAAVDPTFSIDPSTLNASDYSIVASANLASSVPEPAAWTLVIAALGFGKVTRRR